MTRAYCYKFLFAALMVFLGAALINLIADPYGIWGTPRITGLNTAKSFGFHSRIAKYAEWSHWKKSPSTILLGTSRTADGLRTEHAALQNSSVYNMALSGQPIHESFVLFKHALKTGTLKRVVIGLDFFAFNSYWAADVVDENRLIAGSNFDLLFNTSTLTDSFSTLRQSFPGLNIINTSHAHDTAENTKTAPNSIHMRLRFKEVEKIFVSYHRPYPHHLYAYDNAKTGTHTLEDFRTLLSLAYANNIELHLFISPSHAWHWEGLANVGLWKNWESWKQELVKINKDEADKAGKPDYPLWDFSGYNSITTEEVPDQSALNGMKWYSDSSHYNHPCGDLILDRIFAQTNNAIPDDFGLLIDQHNIGRHLSDIREARKNYALSHASDILEMATLSRQFWKH
jgi:hypothetical protein